MFRKKKKEIPSDLELLYFDEMDELADLTDEKFDSEAEELEVEEEVDFDDEAEEEADFEAEEIEEEADFDTEELAEENLEAEEIEEEADFDIEEGFEEEDFDEEDFAEEDFDEEDIDLENDEEDETGLVVLDDSELAIVEEEDEEDGELKVVYLGDEEAVVPAEKKKGLWWKILLGIFITLIVIYLGIAAAFTHFFYYYTTINGVDFSLKTVEDVEAYLEEQVEAYELTLTGATGEQEVITAPSIDLDYQENDEIEKVLKSQNPLLWYKIFYQVFDYTVDVGVDYDDALFDEVTDQLKCTQEATMVEPVSAYPEYSNGAYVIVPEETGTTLKRDVFDSKVEEYLLSMKDELVMYDEGCYTEPEYTTESAEIITLTDTLNQYLKSTITYDEGDVIDADLISTWLKVDDKFEVTLDGDAIEKYVSDLADKNNTIGTTRAITTPNGKSTKVSGGSYGFRVDQSKEVKQIKKDLAGGEPVKRDIEYSSRGASLTGADWGNTYAEVDLSAQKMWYVKDGKTVLETSVVTGCVAQGHATPQGVYSLSYKQANKVLRGTRYPDGTYEYESPVRCWMPFNGGIGFHDADWRSTFGGTIYKTNGSHGCINMPIPAAQTLFSYISAGTPVICHY